MASSSEKRTVREIVSRALSDSSDSAPLVPFSRNGVKVAIALARTCAQPDRSSITVHRRWYSRWVGCTRILSFALGDSIPYSTETWMGGERNLPCLLCKRQLPACFAEADRASWISWLAKLHSTTASYFDYLDEFSNYHFNCRFYAYISPALHLAEVIAWPRYRDLFCTTRANRAADTSLDVSPSLRKQSLLSRFIFVFDHTRARAIFRSLPPPLQIATFLSPML